ncbi:flagellar hook-length control protein FliK [Pseudomonas sp. Marseille-Q0931]|uniref:flagellar hook-length control protein FliK n=1 Tax=Pseudomonas sp. Marseille-Q0931 TaxID=2697507 RepID=UPI0023BA3153|nr:flagellar hook-length control protein FliK [Pseudomonas sp. Marseille-Q0931]
MLQLINANARVSPSGSAEQTLPSGFAQAGSAGDATRPFDQQMAVQGFAAADAQAVPGLSVTPEAIHLSEADAEQWLAGMLGQQAVRIEAREAPEPVQEEQEQVQEDEAEQAAVLPAALLDQAHVQSREQRLPAETLRAATATAPGQPPAPVADPVAVPKSLLTAETATQAAAPLVLDDVVELKAIERLPGSSTDSDKVMPGSAAATSAAPAPLATERPLKLHAPQAQWGEQMLASLREHVDLQINQRIQNATIRLDPPELGSLEIFLSHESGRLSVQLSAANADVARLLQQTSERLRQELVGQNFVQVNVQVSADAQGGRQQQQAQAQAWLAEDAVAAAAVLPSGGERSATESASDVLVTV